MSNTDGIAGVSRTLRKLLRDRMDNPVDVTIAPPDVKVTGKTGKRVNLYLYRVSENGYLKQQEIPGRGHPGAYGHPPLSLDLHYLLTAYGSNETMDDADLEAQQILGDAMRVLHDFPVITPDLREQGGSQAQILDPSLADEFERIKVTLHSLTLEDFSKLWTAMPEAGFRRSVAYEVSVVQIESHVQKRVALPVLDLPRTTSPRVHVVPFKQPQITEVSPALAGIGDTLTVYGVNLANVAQVKIGRLTLPATATAGGQVQFTVPGDAHPDGAPIAEKDRLRAGLQTIQLVATIPTLPGKTLSSNLAAFMLIPTIMAVVPASGTAGDTISVAFMPDFCRGDRAYLFVGDRGLPAEPLPNGVKRSDTLDFELPTAADEEIPAQAGPYPLRLRINGGESRYELVGDPPEPTWKLTVT